MNIIIKLLFVNLLLCFSLPAQISQELEDTIPVDTIYAEDEYEGITPREDYQIPIQIEEEWSLYPVNTIFLGPHFGYIYYEEIFDLNDMKKLAEMDGIVIDSFIGEPKSTEHGLCPGITFSYRYIGEKVPISVSFPHLTLLFGFGNTYDGSYQELDTVGTVIIDEFSPASFTKTNFFLSFGFGLGYLFIIKKFQLHVTSGINGRMWVRSLVERSEVPAGLNVKNYEQYSHFYIPLNAEIKYPVTDKFSIGAHVGLSYMIYGKMQIVFRISDDYGNSIELDAEPVKLGNKFGGTIALLLEPRPSRKVGFRIAPYFKYYEFGKSNIGIMELEGDQAHFYEPASKTFWGGLLFNVMFYPEAKKTP